MLKHVIDEIVSDSPDGWWKSSTRGTYIRLFLYLTEHKNLSNTEAVMVLGEAYHATTGEFGG